MPPQKRFELDLQDIFESPECFAIASAFWNLLGQNVRSNTSTGAVVRIFRAAFELLGLCPEPADAADFVYEQLYLWNAVENQLLRCQVKAQQSPILHKVSLKDGRASARLSEESELTNLHQEFAEVAFESFFKLMVSFGQSMVLGDIAKAFVPFWEYLFMRMIQVSEAGVVLSPPEVRVVFQEDTVKRLQGFEVLWCEEAVQVRRELIYEEHRRLKSTRNIREGSSLPRMGQETQRVLREYRQNQICQPNSGMFAITALISKFRPVYVFFCIKNGDFRLELNPAVFQKCLLEHARKSDCKDKKVVDMLDETDYLTVDHLERFDALVACSVDPYYLDKVVRFPFETQRKHIGHLLTVGRQFATQQLAISPPKVMLQTGKGQIFATKMNGLEQNIAERLPKPNILGCARTGNYLHDRLLEIGRLKAPRILLIGKPCTGKTKVAAILGKVLKLEVVEPEKTITEALKTIEAKAAEFREREGAEMSPEEQRAFQAEKEPFLADLQELDALAEGGELSTDFIGRHLRNRLRSLSNPVKGFIADFSSVLFGKGLLQELLAESEEALQTEYVVHLRISDQTCMERALQTREFREEKEGVASVRAMRAVEIETARMRVERAAFLKEAELPDELKELLETLEPEFKENLENCEALQEQLKCETYSCGSDRKELVMQLIQDFEAKDLNDLKDFVLRCAPEYIGLETEGMSTMDVIAMLLSRLSWSHWDVPQEITEATSIEGMLEAGRDLDAYEMRRNWSFYKTTDCVEFVDQKTVKTGLPENAVSYYNYAFVFASEDNKKKFMACPGRYLKEMPRMAGQVNLLVIAPDGQELREPTRNAAAALGLQFIDMAEYIDKKAREIEEKKDEFMKEVRGRFENTNLVLTEVLRGLGTSEPMPPLDLLKLLVLELGVNLEVRFNEQEEEKLLSEVSDPKNKKKPAPKAVTTTSLGSLVTNAANVAVKNAFYERMRGKDLTDEALKRIPAEPLVAAPVVPIKGFALYNMGVDQEILDFLTQCGLDFHKVISFCNWEAEDAPLWDPKPMHSSVQRVLEGFAETRDLLRSVTPAGVFVSVDFTEAEVLRAEKTIIETADPFKDKIDSDVLRIGYNFDGKGADAELHRLGEFGSICPVKMSEDEWFVQCRAESPTLQINGALYRFSSEEALEKFRKNYDRFLTNATPKILKEKTCNQQRVFLAGAIGFGVNSIAKELSIATGMPILNLKKTLLEQKTSYIREKLLTATLRKGFNSEEFEEQNKIIRACKNDITAVLDKYEPENGEADDKFEENLVKKTLVEGKQKIIVLDLYFSEEERQIFKADLKEILERLRLVPDNLITLRAGEFVAHNRIFKPNELRERLEKVRKDIETKNQAALERKRQEIWEERVKEDPEAKLEDVEVGEADVELQPEPNIDEEIEKENTSIREKRERQTELIADFSEFAKEKLTAVCAINTELPLQKAVTGCLEFIRGVWKTQANYFQRCRFASVADDPDNDDLNSQNKLQKMTDSFGFSLSSLGRRCLAQPKATCDSFDYNIVHEGQVYLFGSEELRKAFLECPEIPPRTAKLQASDLHATLFFLKPMADRNLRSKLKTQFGMPIVSLQKAVKYFFGPQKQHGLPALTHSNLPLALRKIKKTDLQIAELSGPFLAETDDPTLRAIRECLESGAPLSDSFQVFLVYKYLQKTALQEREGVILEDFPRNISQLHLLKSYGVFPNLCFTFCFDDALATLSGADADPFYRHSETMKALTQQLSWERRSLEEFLAANFANLFTLNARKSSEGNLQIIREIFDRHMDALLQTFPVDRQVLPYHADLLPFSRHHLDDKLSSMGRVAITSQNSSLGNQVVLNKRENFVVHKKEVLADPRGLSVPKETSPGKNVSLRVPVLPQVSLDSLCCILNDTGAPAFKFDVACPISLSQRKAVAGKSNLTLTYGDSRFQFGNLLHLHKFFMHPGIYAAQRPSADLIAKVQAQPVEVTPEKQVIDELSIAMNHICKLKLKSPSLSVKQTALEMLSLFLKCRNPFQNEAYRRKYRMRLDKFISQCQQVDRLAVEMDLDQKHNKHFETKLLRQRLEGFVGGLDAERTPKEI